MSQQAAYEHLRGLLPPGRYPRPGGSADGAVWMLGGLLDELVQTETDAVLDWIATQAREEALSLIGRGRGLERYPGETLEAYRTRVVAALEFWQQAGTERGIRLALKQLGYESSLVPVRTYDAARWSEFDVYLYADTRSYDGSDAEKARILGILKRAKPAHTRLGTVQYIPFGPLTWDPPGLTWDPPGQVWGQPPVVLYP